MHAGRDNRARLQVALSRSNRPRISAGRKPPAESPMADFTTQRFHMVEGQVRANDVTDVRIHHAMLAVQRERFVPMAKRSAAYMDRPVEIAPGRYLLDPRTFSKLVQLAELSDTDTVLDVA